MANHLPKRGAIIEVNEWGQPKLPPKAERVYGKPGKSDHVGMYRDSSGKVETVDYRVPKQDKKTKGGPAGGDDAAAVAKPRPDVTRKGHEMIGDIRTDALHEALGRAPIEEDTLLALLVLAFAGQNVSIASGASDNPYGHARVERHLLRLTSPQGRPARPGGSWRVSPRSRWAGPPSCRTRARRNFCAASRVPRWKAPARARPSCLALGSRTPGPSSRSTSPMASTFIRARCSPRRLRTSQPGLGAFPAARIRTMNLLRRRRSPTRKPRTQIPRTIRPVASP